MVGMSYMAIVGILWRGGRGVHGYPSVTYGSTATRRGGAIASVGRAVLCGDDLPHATMLACAACRPQAILPARTHTIIIVIQSFAYLFPLVII